MSPYAYTVNILTNFTRAAVGVEKSWLWRDPKKRMNFA